MEVYLKNNNNLEKKTPQKTCFAVDSRQKAKYQTELISKDRHATQPDVATLQAGYFIWGQKENCFYFLNNYEDGLIPLQW